jgi:hypothetical protein
MTKAGAKVKAQAPINHASDHDALIDEEHHDGLDRYLADFFAASMRACNSSMLIPVLAEAI